MRRKEREIIDLKEMDEIIANCDCCRIALMDGAVPYIVPLNFGYEKAEEKRYFYFHCAKQGHKLDLIEKNDHVGFELDNEHSLIENEEACYYSYHYQSIIGSGKITILENEEDKRKALSKIMLQYTHKENWCYDDKAVDAVHLLRLEVDKMSGKKY